MSAGVGLAYPVGLGPGSQILADAEPTPEYLSMPKEMRTWQPQFLPEQADPAAHPRLWAVFERLQQALDAAVADGVDTAIDLAGLDNTELALLADTLGEGEVSARAESGSQWRCEVQETALIGVWRVQRLGAGTEILRDRLEVCAFPRQLLGQWPTRSSAEFPARATAALSGTMNAAPVLTEILDRSAHFRGPQDHHVINFSLLPMTEADLALLGERLGRAGLSLLSRGYGNCRMTACALPNTWWVQYFNSTDQLILNTIEITDLPQVAQADRDDLADSARRLRTMLGTER